MMFLCLIFSWIRLETLKLYILAFFLKNSVEIRSSIRLISVRLVWIVESPCVLTRLIVND